MKKVAVFLLVLSTISSYALKSKADKVAADQKVIFEVELDSAIKYKPVLVVFENAFYQEGNPLAEQEEYEPVAQSGRKYKFILPAQIQPRYFTLKAYSKPRVSFFLSMFFFEPGDNVSMKIKKGSRFEDFGAEFTGKQAAKYNCMQDLKHVSDVNKVLALLDEYKSELSVYAYQLIKIDKISKLRYNALISENSIYFDSVEKGDNNRASELKAIFLKTDVLSENSDVPMKIKINSMEFLHTLYTEMAAKNSVQSGPGKFPLLYENIKKLSDSQLRERMIVMFFINDWRNLPVNYDSILKDAMSNTKDSYFQNKLKSFLHNSNGQKAFNFALQDASGRIVKLSDFKGKAVFIDFYFTGCTFCKIYYKSVLSDVEKKYIANPDIVFVTISVDRDKDRWLKTLKEGEYTSNTSINLYTNGEWGNHPLIQYHNIQSFPSLMLVDRDGRIFKFTGKEMRSKEGLEDALNAVLKK